jgi:hypothetical protein
MVVGDFDFTNNGQPLTALPAILQALNATYTRNSLKNVVQNGALVALSANTFGTSMDDVTGLYGYAPEPAATNLATNSDGNASTYSTRDQVADGTAVPGFTNGIAFGNNSVLRYAYKPLILTASTAYTCSFFVQMDDGGAPVVGTTNSTGDFCVIVDGAFTTNQLVRSIGSGVYRVSGSVASAAGGANRNNGIVKFTTQSARTFRATQIQVETGLRATSTIYTDGSTKTRAADVLTVPLANIPGFNAAGYTLMVDVRKDVTGGTGGTIVLAVGADASNRAMTYLTTGGGFQTFAYVSGVNGSVSAQVNPSMSRYKQAMSLTASAGIAASNGALLSVAGTPAMVASPTTLGIGSGFSQTPCNCFIFRAQLIPTALTQAQLNGLTK